MNWIQQRAAEKSTVLGAVVSIVTAAAAVYTGPHVDLVTQGMQLLGALFGGGLMAATTKK